MLGKVRMLLESSIELLSKIVDDGVMAVSVNLKSSVVPDPVVRPRPNDYHEKTGHVLPVKNNLL